MKKFTVLAAAVLTMAMAFTGCSSSDKGETSSTSAETSAEASTSAEGEAVSLEGKTITMATNAEFPPYEYYEGDKVVGIDADIAVALGEKLGCEVKIEDMAFDAVIPAVQSGKAEFGSAGITATEDRAKMVDFSTSYAKGVQVVIVTEDSPIKSVDDLFAEGANNKIGVQTQTTGDLYSTSDIEEKGLGTVERYNKGADAVQALKTGKIDCVVIDNEPAKAFVAANEGLKILETEYIVEDYAMCFAKDSEVGKVINGALEELIEDGTIQSIIDKYITAE